MIYDNIAGKCKTFEQSVKVVTEQFSMLVKQVIQKNLHRNDDVDLEDIEQEVRLKIWKFLKKGKKVDNLASYIKRVAYSTTIDELRRMMKQRPSRDLESLKTVFNGTRGLSSRVMAGDYSPRRCGWRQRRQSNRSSTLVELLERETGKGD